MSLRFIAIAMESDMTGINDKYTNEDSNGIITLSVKINTPFFAFLVVKCCIPSSPKRKVNKIYVDFFILNPSSEILFFFLFRYISPNFFPEIAIMTVATINMIILIIIKFPRMFPKIASLSSHGSMTLLFPKVATVIKTVPKAHAKPVNTVFK